MSSLQGLADVTALPAVPTLSSYAAEPVELGQVEVFHATYEISTDRALHALPPALFPSNPALVSWLAYRSTDGPYGPFTMLQTRLACVAGISKRALVVECLVDNDELRADLEARWGFPAAPGDVSFLNRADRIDLVASAASGAHLEVQLVDPVLLPDVDVPILAGLNLSATPEGVQIVELQVSHAPLGPALRGVPRFDAGADRSSLTATLLPASPVVGTLQAAEVTLSPIRRTIDPVVPYAAAVTELR